MNAVGTRSRNVSYVDQYVTTEAFTNDLIRRSARIA